MKDSDIDTLSADGAQESMQSPDPRAALAKALHEAGGEHCDPFTADHPVAMHNSQAAALGGLVAERGVLLVTEERLAAALVDVDVIGYWTDPHGYVMDSASAAAAIFAALSAPADG